MMVAPANFCTSLLRTQESRFGLAEDGLARFKAGSGLLLSQEQVRDGTACIHVEARTGTSRKSVNFVNFRA